MYVYPNLDMTNNSGVLIQHYNRSTKRTTSYIATNMDVTAPTIADEITEWNGRPINYFHELQMAIQLLVSNEGFLKYIQTNISNPLSVGSVMYQLIQNTLHYIYRIYPFDQTPFIVIEIVEDKDLISISQYDKDGHVIKNTVSFNKEDF